MIRSLATIPSENVYLATREPQSLSRRESRDTRVAKMVVFNRPRRARKPPTLSILGESRRAPFRVCVLHYYYSNVNSIFHFNASQLKSWRVAHERETPLPGEPVDGGVPEKLAPLLSFFVRFPGCFRFRGRTRNF